MTNKHKIWLKWFGGTGLIATFVLVMVAGGYANTLFKHYIATMGKDCFITNETYAKDKEATEEIQAEISKDLKVILKNLRNINATLASNKIKMINVEVGE